jgi:hypothetical protein
MIIALPVGFHYQHYHHLVNYEHHFSTRCYGSTYYNHPCQYIPEHFLYPSRIDETIIDEHIEIFRELGAIAEGYLKLIYGIKHNCHTNQDLEKLDFHHIWKNLKQDSNFGVFTKPFPNTIYWNALKHNKFRKNVGSCEIELRSNNGRRILNYSDFRSLIRELYACTLVLTKINLMLRFASSG